MAGVAIASAARLAPQRAAVLNVIDVVPEKLAQAKARYCHINAMEGERLRFVRRRSRFVEKLKLRLA
jgi:hypothetical protein